jgi:hypothetical protein
MEIELIIEYIILEWSTQANNLKGCKKPKGFSKEANIFYEQGS